MLAQRAPLPTLGAFNLILKQSKLIGLIKRVLQAVTYAMAMVVLEEVVVVVVVVVEGKSWWWWWWWRK